MVRVCSNSERFKILFQYDSTLFFYNCFYILSKIKSNESVIMSQVLIIYFLYHIARSIKNLVIPRYPPQFLNNQSDRSSIVKRDGQKSIAFLPVLQLVKDYFSIG